MITEFLFLQGHKFIDWTLFTVSHGWKWRPYYQVPRVFNYSYGNQGLHVQNIYDPFANKAYETGPMYRAMEWAVDAVGQGPNPSWIRKRQRMIAALNEANFVMQARFLPEQASRSLKTQMYYLKQFSLVLHAQWIYKYFPTFLTSILEYKILPPLLEHFPQAFHFVEYQARKIDYFFANKSLGYHLFIDLLEQLNPPLDAEDRVVPYDYIAETGSRIIAQYKDYTYLAEWLQDLTREIKGYSDLYDQFLRAAKEEKYEAMAKGDPMATQYIPPSIQEYCLKFHNYDIAQKSEVLVDLNRVCKSYRTHISYPDAAMLHLHKFLFSSSEPEIYGRYRKQRQVLTTTREYISTKAAILDQEAKALGYASGKHLGAKNIELSKQSDIDNKFNPFNTLLRDSQTANELTPQQRLQALENQYTADTNATLFNLDRANVKQVKERFGNKDAPLYNTDQLPQELQALHANILKDVFSVLPVSLQDPSLVQPLFQKYHNDRVNEFMYTYHPSILEPDVKQELDYRYDKTQIEQYRDYIHERIEKRKEMKQKRAEILAPYKALDFMRENHHRYQVDRDTIMYEDMILADESIEQPLYAYPGLISTKIEHATAEQRYQHYQRWAYKKMITDYEKVHNIELEKAIKATNGWDSIRRKNQLHNAKWDPFNRIKDSVPPLTSTIIQNKRHCPENYTPEQMRTYSHMFPGVPFDQLLTVVDQHDTYRPPIVDKSGKETMDWIGLPRTKGTPDWTALRHRDEMKRIKEENTALMYLYKTRLHDTDDDQREMKHGFILSMDVPDIRAQSPTQ